MGQGSLLPSPVAADCHHRHITGEASRLQRAASTVSGAIYKFINTRGQGGFLDWNMGMMKLKIGSAIIKPARPCLAAIRWTVIIHHESRIENVVFTIWPCYTRLVKDPKTQRPKGFGFVLFRLEDEAQKALEAMNGRIVRGRLIFVKVASTGSPENGDSSA
ncbi:hypothetical protein Q3G72_007344 [Acer saccharum]|nr:hypothetical protein Q3G72_007344 [Acer saccharum]